MSPDLSALRVLVVDDMIAFRNIARSHLQAMGFTSIVEVADGETALQAIESACNDNLPFNLIICDWRMPRLSGLEVLKAVRRSPQTKDTPFVMLTAESELSNVSEAVRSGVSEYLVKPFTNEQLYKKLAAILNERPNMEENV